jgi:hypothetical protein
MYQQCLDTKSITGFYNKVTLDFVAKCGQKEPFNRECPMDPLDLEDGSCDNDNNDLNSAPQSTEEAAQNMVLFTQL